MRITLIVATVLYILGLTGILAVPVCHAAKHQLPTEIFWISLVLALTGGGLAIFVGLERNAEDEL